MGAVGKAISKAVTGPVENIINAGEKLVTDPTKLTLGDAVALGQPVGGSTTKTAVENPETIPVYAAAVGGAALSLNSGAILGGATAKTAGVTTPGSVGPLFAPPAGFGVSTSSLNLAAAGTPAIGGAPIGTVSTGGGFFSSLAAGFSTKGGSIGVGDAVLNGLGNIPNAIGQAAPFLLLSKFLGGSGVPGGSGADLGGFSISIPQGLRDAAASFIPANFGWGGGSAASSDPRDTQRAGMDPLMLILVVGLGLGVLYFFFGKKLRR